VGLDLGLRLSSISFVDGEGIELLHQECPTTLPRLKEALAAFPRERIGLVAVEASNEMHIVRKLRDAGYPVAIFESRKASKFLAVRNNKTDAGDARGLADLARIGRNVVPQVYLKSPECQQLRGLLVMRKRFVMMRVAAEAALRSNLALHGRRLRSVHAPGILRRAVEAELAELRTEEGIDLSGDLQPMVDVCESLRAYLKKLERDLERTAKSHTVCRLLMEVPGVGPICALSFYSAIEDPDRFRSASDVGAYLGLSPRRYQSGRTSRTLGITKAGSKLTRTHLVTAATVFGNTAPDCALKRWFMALRERAGSKRARVALARKLAVILLTMWKDGAHFHLYPAEAMAAAQARGAVTAGD
jgi:transposase